MDRLGKRCEQEKDTTMTSQPYLLSRRTFLTAVSLGIAGSAVSLGRVSALVPETNARSQPSSINIVLYDDKIDVDKRLFPLQQNLDYAFAVRSECKMGFHAFHIVNAKNDRLLTIPNVGPGQAVPLKWMFLEAGDYTLINEHLSGYLMPGGLVETKVTVENFTAEVSVC
jgi:hypothetical protein